MKNFDVNNPGIARRQPRLCVISIVCSSGGEYDRTRQYMTHIIRSKKDIEEKGLGLSHKDYLIDEEKGGLDERRRKRREKRKNQRKYLKPEEAFGEIL